MFSISPKIAEFLLKATKERDISEAFYKVLREYFELKIKDLQEDIAKFNTKWNLNFEEFSKKIKENSLGKNSYFFEVENDFWQWEEVITLERHYQSIIT